MARIKFDNGVEVDVEGEPSEEQVIAIWNDIQSQRTPDKELLPQDVRPNGFREILGFAARGAVEALPPVANITQPENYTKAFLTGLQQPAEELMGVPEGKPGVMSSALRNPFNPMQSGAEMARDIVQDPVNFAKKSVAEGVGMATAPVNYTIPGALEAAKLIPIGKTNLGTILKLPPKRIKDALQGKIAPEAIERFMGNLEKLKPLAKHLPDEIKSKPIEQDQNLQSKLMQEIKAAKPVRREQEALYTKERTERFGKAEGISKQTSGQSGFQNELATLKGELPKANYEPITSKFSQDETDQLLDMIKNTSKLQYIETVAGRNALLKMMQGKVPNESELALLKKVFGSKLESVLDGKLPLQDRLWKYMLTAGNLSRGLMATADMSMPFRQGIFLVSKPKQFAPAFREMFKHFFSEKALSEFQASLTTRPTFKLMRDSKLALTELDGVLSKREEQFLASDDVIGQVYDKVKNIPVAKQIVRGVKESVRASNRAAVGFLNKLRADVFDDLVDKAWKSGRDPYNDLSLTSSIADFINSATGRGNIKGIERALPVLNATLFSPRLLMSRINLLNPTYYMGLDPFVRKEALKTLAGTVATLSTVLYLARLGGAEVEPEPYATDFGKIKTGNTRHDIGGGFLQLIRLYAQLIGGKTKSSTGKEYKLGDKKQYKPMTRLDVMSRFVEYKTAPLLSLAISLARGTDAIGEEVNIKTLPKDIAERYVPLVLHDLYDLYKEGGIKELPKGIPAFFGVSTMTYKPKESSSMASEMKAKLKRSLKARLRR